ncbi:unnamed protein product [Pylaiella littoralis]
MTEENLYQKIFASHFGHLAIIFLWTSGNLFHVAWQGNFEQWSLNPLKVKPIAHTIWDPHFGELAMKAFTKGGAFYPVNISYSGVYHWWYTIGMRTNNDLYIGSIFLIALSSLLLFAGITSLVAQHMYAIPPYAFMAKDFTTQAALYTHHQYIAGFLMVGAFAHGAIFFVRDYDPEANQDNVLARMLEHKEAIISHLSWVSIFRFSYIRFIYS